MTEEEKKITNTWGVWTPNHNRGGLSVDVEILFTPFEEEEEKKKKNQMGICGKFRVPADMDP